MGTIVGHGLDKLLINGYMGEMSKLKVNNLSAHTRVDWQTFKFREHIFIAFDVSEMLTPNTFSNA